MKTKLLIGLIAFTVMLGMACKKDEMSDPKLKVEKKMNGDEGTIDHLAGDIVGQNPFGMNGQHTTEYDQMHPWSILYPNGWPKPHPSHDGCAGVRRIGDADNSIYLWFPK